MRRGRLSRLLESPTIYNLKTRFFSVGRANVWKYLERFATISAYGRVLDVGCGTGRHSEIFSAVFVGVDINPHYVAFARHRHRGAFVLMDARALALADKSFELVYAAGLLHHLSDEGAKSAVREMIRVAKRNGTVLIVDAVIPAVWNVVGRMLFRLDRGEYPRTVDALGVLLDDGQFTVEFANLPGSWPYQRAVFRRTGRG